MAKMYQAPVKEAGTPATTEPTLAVSRGSAAPREGMAEGDKDERQGSYNQPLTGIGFDREESSTPHWANDPVRRNNIMLSLAAAGRCMHADCQRLRGVALAAAGMGEQDLSSSVAGTAIPKDMIEGLRKMDNSGVYANLLARQHEH
ncbi:hypothetical protein UFOVP361_148 [uncultured Caudovirales phage]|uniref:Uncharacterized protein n=1 Tax=uncultured Caudovirales phage TaxID=2100421 RepID=A0A6J7WZQ5_9CAUD|nr:hypothetical protein UFOVP361_148 [uncultured Caudovirales phage]